MNNTNVILIICIIIGIIISIASLIYYIHTNPITIESQSNNENINGSIYPEHWGRPPTITTKDYVKLPDGYGYGSSTLRKWIIQCITLDKHMVDVKNEYMLTHTKNLKWYIPTNMHVDTVYTMFVHHYTPNILSRDKIYKISSKDSVTMDFDMDRLRIVYDYQTMHALHIQRIG